MNITSTAPTPDDKPYNVCIECVHIGKVCDGPNFLAMTTERLSEWCKLRKDYLHKQDARWTNSYIAEVAEVSKTTVDRFLSSAYDDIKTSTLTRIIKVLVNGTWGQYPCAMAAQEKEVVTVDNPETISKLEEAYNQCRVLQQSLDTAHNDEHRRLSFLKEQLAVKDRLLQERFDFLTRKDRVIKILSILLGIAVLLILTALAADITIPDKGFFWTRTN